MRFYTLLLLVLLAACNQKPKTTSTLKKLYVNQYAQKFEILDSGDSIVLRVHNPWQGADSVSFDYPFAKQNHSPEPRRVVCMSSSHVAFLDALSATSSVVGVSGSKFITNPQIRNSQVPDVGYDNNMNYELIVALKPDCVFVYEVAGENSASTKKLEQLGVPVIYIADYLEQSPLARAEWLVAFGAIMGCPDRAELLFNDIAARYNSIKDSVAKIANTKPRVMLNSPYRDVWYMPGDRSYMIQLLNDAGGDYMGKGVDNDISRPISAEVAYELLSSADIWLNPGTSTTLGGLKADNPRFASLPVVRKGMIFNNNARNTPDGGSDFWESGSLRADIILLDLAKIFNPEEFQNDSLYYYHRLK